METAIFNCWRHIIIVALILLFVMTSIRVVLADPVENPGTNASVEEQIAEMVSHLDATNWGAFQELTREESNHREEIIQTFLKILNDPQLKINDYGKCVAADYLGELSASEAVDSLAAHISNHSRFC
jgi:hypothetical protein